VRKPDRRPRTYPRIAVRRGRGFAARSDATVIVSECFYTRVLKLIGFIKRLSRVQTEKKENRKLSA